MDKLLTQLDCPRCERKPHEHRKPRNHRDAKSKSVEPSRPSKFLGKVRGDKADYKNKRKPFPNKKPAKAHQLEPYSEDSESEEESDASSETSTDSVTNNMVEIFQLDGDEWSQSIEEVLAAR